MSDADDIYKSVRALVSSKSQGKRRDEAPQPTSDSPEYDEAAVDAYVRKRDATPARDESASALEDAAMRLAQLVAISNAKNMDDLFEQGAKWAHAQMSARLADEIKERQMWAKNCATLVDENARLRSQVSGLEADVEMKDISVKQWTECANKHVDRIEELEAELDDWKSARGIPLAQYERATRRMEVLEGALEGIVKYGDIPSEQNKISHIVMLASIVNTARRALLSAPDKEGAP